MHDLPLALNKEDYVELIYMVLHKILDYQSILEYNFEKLHALGFLTSFAQMIKNNIDFISKRILELTNIKDKLEGQLAELTKWEVS